jgi:predicted dehydrogenase
MSCADAQETNAAARTRVFAIKVQDKSVDLLLNLKTPQSHGPTKLHALKAGKYVYWEKALDLSAEATRPVLTAATGRKTSG